MHRQQLPSQRSRRSFNERLRTSASVPASRARYDDERRGPQHDSGRQHASLARAGQAGKANAPEGVHACLI